MCNCLEMRATWPFKEKEEIHCGWRGMSWAESQKARRGAGQGSDLAVPHGLWQGAWAFFQEQ